MVLLGVWYGARVRDRRANLALRLSEERFRHLTSLSADWFWETDAEHRISWLSGGPAVAALLGNELAHGKRLWEVPGITVEPRRLVKHLERLLHIDAQLPMFDFEVTGTDASGVRCVHTVLGRARYDSEGRFLGYRGVGRDITLRRCAEHALGDAKERLQSALDGSNSSIWNTDLRTGEVYLSEGWAELLGQPREPTYTTVEALAGKVHPVDLARVKQSQLETMKGLREAYIEEHRVRTAKGDWKWVQSRGKVVERDAASGRALRMTGTNIDITERKRAEQATRDAEERYRALIELAPDGVTVFCDDVIEYANPAAARILKAGSPKRLAGISVASTIHPDHLGEFTKRMDYLRAGPATTGFAERKLRCLDGSDVIVEAASVSFLERGRQIGRAHV